MCMKNIFKFLLLSPIAFSSVGCGQAKQPEEPKPVDVVLISGQSNGVGQRGVDDIVACFSQGEGVRVILDCQQTAIIHFEFHALGVARQELHF